MGSISPNDLRHYRTRRIAAELHEGAGLLARPKVGLGPVGPVLTSLDTVLDTILKTATGGLPRALLVAGTAPRADAATPAINLARALADRNEQVVLVDLAKGASGIDDTLGVPRVPGFCDLISGRAGFIDVVHLDHETELQAIAAGTVTACGEHEQDRFMRVFEALTQTYDCVVLHADLEGLDACMPALKFELAASLAVFPARTTMAAEAEALDRFRSLGCPVLVYDAHRKRRVTRMFSRAAA